MNYALAAQALEPGTELGDGLRVGHGGVITGGPVVKLTHNREETQMKKATKRTRTRKHGTPQERRAEREAKLAKMTPKQRAEICGPGLRGKARKLFIEKGLTLEMQVRAAESKRQAVEAAKEDTEMAKTKKTRKQATERKPRKRQALPEGVVTAADIAKAAGVTPRELRGYLRERKIAKDAKTGRYQWPSLKNRTVQSIIKGVKAARA